MSEIKKVAVDRRSLVKGAAWSVPVVAAAVAAPVAAATGDEIPDTCAGCFKAGSLLGLGLGLSASVVLGNSGLMSFNTGIGIDSNGGDCNFNILTGVAYTGLITKGTLYWRNNRTGAETSKTSTIALGAQLGVVGTSLGTGVIPFAFTGMPFPNGLYAGSNPPAEPTRLCVTVNFSIKAGVIPIPNAVDVSCDEELCWDMSMQAAGAVVLGAGEVNFLGLDFTPVV